MTRLRSGCRALKSSAQILVRCDGSSRLGMGHTMRCIALAQALRNAGRTVAFACRELPGNGLALIRERGFPAHALAADSLVQDAGATLALAELLGAKAILVDLSHADTLACPDGFVNLLGTLTSSALYVCVIEGMNEECISLRVALPVASVIVPYFGADKLHYRLAPRSRIFSGEKYFPLRTEFLRTPRQSHPMPEHAERILIAIGGGNVANLNRQVVDALAKLGRSTLKVKVLGAIEGVDSLPLPVEVIPYSKNMPELIAWADCAVIGSGLTRYETAYIGTPAVVFSLNQEHARMVKAFAATGAVLDGGMFSATPPAAMGDVILSLLDNKNLRAHMAAIGPSLIDGKGSERLAAEVFDGEQLGIALRPKAHHAA